MKKLVAVGPNPAWQKTLFFERFRENGINRAREMQAFPAGKGINFCRAVRCHGRAEGRLIQFAGGDTGRRVCEELAREGMPVWTVETGTATRTCNTCLCESTRTMTEIIEPSYAATTPEVEKLLGYFADALHEADGAAFCGTLPTGTDPLLYARAAQLLKASPRPVLIDACRDVRPIFGSGLEIYLKINADELREMTGCTTVRGGLHDLFTASGPTPRLAAITDGENEAFCSDGKRLMVYRLPRLEKVVNPIGCGDTASAVWMSELVNGSDPFEAFRIALGAASANCMSAFPGSFVPAEAAAIAAAIVVREETF